MASIPKKSVLQADLLAGLFTFLSLDQLRDVFDDIGT
jgi:hypothetical protein